MLALHWAFIFAVLWTVANQNEYPAEMGAEELANGGWCRVAGREITVDVPTLYLDSWCCTARGDEMTFLNTRPFKYGKKASYTQFLGVSFITGMFMELAHLQGKHVKIRGRLIVYGGTPEIIVNSPSQVWEVNE